MNIKNAFHLFWDNEHKRMERIDLLNGSRFQKIHQEFINKHKPGHKDYKQIRKLLGELAAIIKRTRR